VLIPIAQESMTFRNGKKLSMCLLFSMVYTPKIVAINAQTIVNGNRKKEYFALE
jgi:hypothetical protein